MADQLVERVGLLRHGSVFGLVRQPELEVLATMFYSRIFTAGPSTCL
jgi:hypothetical protein